MRTGPMERIHPPMKRHTGWSKQWPNTIEVMFCYKNFPDECGVTGYKAVQFLGRCRCLKGDYCIRLKSIWWKAGQHLPMKNRVEVFFFGETHSWPWNFQFHSTFTQLHAISNTFYLLMTLHGVISNTYFHREKFKYQEFFYATEKDTNIWFLYPPFGLGQAAKNTYP